MIEFFNILHYAYFTNQKYFYLNTKRFDGYTAILISGTTINNMHKSFFITALDDV